MAMDWLALIGVGLSSGAAVKALDFSYSSYLLHRNEKKSAAQFVDDNIVQILKTADELVGKTCYLAREDFKSFKDFDPANFMAHNDYLSYYYLIAKFWAYVEIFKHKGLSVEVGRDKRGKELQAFLDCLESRQTRLSERIVQRAIAELMIKNDHTAVAGFIEFISLLENNDEKTMRWFSVLGNLLARIHQDKSVRQTFLQYVIVVHALTDTLDPHHLITRNRPSYPNKLTVKSQRHVKYAIFGKYLTFVEDNKFREQPHKSRSLPVG